MSAPAAQPAVTWKEVTEARFWEMLEILFPRFHADFGFLVGEPYTHRVCAVGGDFRGAYSAFYETAGRYFEASGPMTEAEFRAVQAADVLASAGMADEAAAIAALQAEFRELQAVRKAAVTNDDLDCLFDRAEDLDRRAMALPVTTPAGAIAALKWICGDLEMDGALSGRAFYSALIKGAIAVLASAGVAA